MNVTLGLLYGTVELVSYTAEWSRLFAVEAARLREALSGWSCAVEHVGSTAVPGLAAKPILDIVVGLGAGVSPDDIVATLEKIGYEYRGDAGAQGGRLMVREASPRVRTHHLHMVALDDDQWASYLALRDLLRASLEARDLYSETKRALATLHASDRKAYSQAKTEIIRQLLVETGRGDDGWTALGKGESQ